MIRIEAIPEGGRREQLRMSAEGLISGVGYRLIVDGTYIGSTLARSGFVRVIFTSDGSSGQVLPPLFRPVINIRHIELQDERGQPVLQGNFGSNQTLGK